MSIFSKLFGSPSKKVYFSAPSLRIRRGSMDYIGDPKDLTEMKLEIVNLLYREKGINASIDDIILEA